jgi:hypothetical protein
MKTDQGKVLTEKDYKTLVKIFYKSGSGKGFEMDEK